MVYLRNVLLRLRLQSAKRALLLRSHCRCGSLSLRTQMGCHFVGLLRKLGGTSGQMLRKFMLFFEYRLQGLHVRSLLLLQLLHLRTECTQRLRE